MKWTINHKYVNKEVVEYGDKKVRKRFCFFPKAQYDITTNSSTFYWLQYVYVVYEWTEGIDVEWDFSGLPVYEPDYWRQIGIAATYDNAIKEFGVNKY